MSIPPTTFVDSIYEPKTTRHSLTLDPDTYLSGRLWSEVIGDTDLLHSFLLVGGYHLVGVDSWRVSALRE